MSKAIDELRRVLDKNESMHDYAIATDSVRAHLDFIEQELTKANKEREQLIVQAYIDGKLKYTYTKGVTIREKAEQYYNEVIKPKYK